MTVLPSQEFLENLLKNPSDPIVIILFTASWCGPCSKLDKNYLVGLSDKIKWYVCDIDENKYTPGYCSVKSIPAFLVIVNGKAKPLFTSSDTLKVADWIKGGFN